MRFCWLLALGLVIGPVGLRDAAAEDPTATACRKAESAKVDDGDGAQATLSALSAAVRITPVRRNASKSAPAATGEFAPTVRLVENPLHTAAESVGDEKSLDTVSARLVSHSEAASEPAAIILDKAPEKKHPIVRPATVRPATVWTPTEVGDVEDDSKPPVTSPVASPIISPITSTAFSVEKREPAPAVVGDAANPLRQAPTSSTFSLRNSTNPLR